MQHLHNALEKNKTAITSSPQLEPVQISLDGKAKGFWCNELG